MSRAEASLFRKKPVVIEAERFNICEWPFGNPFGVVEFHEKCDSSIAACSLDGQYYISTLEGNMIVRDGDWVIKGVKGEHYACRADIFVQTYEPVFPDKDTQ